MLAQVVQAIPAIVKTLACKESKHNTIITSLILVIVSFKIKIVNACCLSQADLLFGYILYEIEIL